MRPLQDIRIIAIEQYGAGPFGTLHLADMGADIIKIEDPRAGGDVGRYVPPFQNGEDSLFFETFNRNKRSLSLDITTHDGRQVFEDLVKVSDAVYSNLRGDVPQRLRICYDDLKHLNPAIVCCSLTGFGMTGPRQTSPGYDYLLQGLAGWMSLTGEPDAPPTKSGLSLVDFSGGYVGALSLMIGLHAARRDGLGMDCDVSLFDTAINMLSYPATWHLSAGFEPQRTSHSAHPSVVPFQNFETADGWIVVACPKEKFWQQLAATLDRPELATDDRFSTFAARHANSTELLTILKALFQDQTSDYWLTRLQAAGIPCAPVNSVADALSDPHTEARQMIAKVPHPHFGTVQQPASPVKVGNDPTPYRRAPRRHEDAPAILADLLQYSSEKITALKQGGAFGSVDSPSSP